MLPNSTDPRWRKLLVAGATFEPQSFALKLLLARLRRDVQREAGEKRVEVAIEELRGFFERHAEISRHDLQSIFEAR